MKMQMLIVCLFIGSALSMPGQHTHHEEKEEEEGQFLIFYLIFLGLWIFGYFGFLTAIRTRASSASSARPSFQAHLHISQLLSVTLMVIRENPRNIPVCGKMREIVTASLIFHQ
jgi:hypothetical protein